MKRILGLLAGALWFASAASVPIAISAPVPVPAPAPAARRVRSEAPPDLSGDWVLDIARSEFGPGAQNIPRWRRDRVRHRGAIIEVHPQVLKAVGDTATMQYSYRTDGRPAVNEILKQPVRTTGHWKRDTLELSSAVQVLTNRFLMLERWSLADAGRTLVIDRDSDSPLGHRHSRMVYHRE